MDVRFRMPMEMRADTRVAQPLLASRACACNSHIVSDFVDKLAEIFDRLKLASRPQNIFNVDETRFQTDIDSQKIICEKGIRNPHKHNVQSKGVLFST